MGNFSAAPNDDRVTKFSYTRDGETFTIGDKGFSLIDADGTVQMERTIDMPADVIVSTILDLILAGWIEVKGTPLIGAVAPVRVPSSGVLWEELIAAVQTAGHEAGHSAAAWWQQDVLGGRASASADIKATALATIKGIDDGDPAVLDALPSADLSGQWSDGDTVRDIYEANKDSGSCDFDGLDEWQQTEIGDTWEQAFNASATDAIHAYCRAALEN